MKKFTAIKPFFKHNLLFSLMLLSINSAQASIVRGDINYQYFRDFAENKGQFALGATNVEIFDKNGQSVGTMLKDVPMIDFSAISRGNGYATLVKPQYIVSVQHNRGYQSVQFGDHSNVNPDSHHFDYQIANRHITAPGVEISSWHRDDYHTPRLHKLVTEVVPMPTSDETHIREFTNKDKYTIFVRAGSGVQEVIDVKGDTARNVAGAYRFLTGGSMLGSPRVYNNSAIPGNTPDTFLRFDGPNALFDQPMSSSQRSGDSGSGVFAWDAQAGRWVYVASAQSSTVANTFVISHLGLVDKNEQLSIAGTVIGNEQTLLWTPSANSSTLSANGQELLNVGLADANLAERDGVNNGHWFRPRQDHGKTFTISGENNTLRLADNIDQGAGAIYFTGNTTVEGVKEGTTWLGAGVSIDKDKTVTWKIGNPDKDRLSKIGEGTLLVQGVGKNLGSISVGDGTVILDQRADVKNEKEAFSEVGIVSGRSTVVLNSADQVNPDHIYFGFRGGRLDVNGNDLTFNRIQNADEGARIVNHNLSKATTVTVGKQLTQPLLTEQDIEWVNGRARAGHIHINTHADGHTDYYVLIRGELQNSFLPAKGQSNSRWLLLASNDRAAAARAYLERENAKRIPVAGQDTFSGILGETDETKNNGQLNFVYDPVPKDDVYMLNGGANLNGNVIVKNGNLMLSGRPVPHAYDHLNRTEVIKDDEWLNRTFNMTTLVVQDNATAYIGRNVSVVNANLSASQNAAIQAGFINGVTPVCIRSDYNGNTTCTTPTYDSAILDTIPSTAINGNVSLIDNATLTLGKANLTGKISGTALTTVNLSADGVWNMTADSDVGNLNLTAGSVVNLNNENNAQQGHYQTLNITGNLTGEGLFNYQTNLTQFQGDKVNVSGNASGTHRLNVSNTGTEPTKSKEHLTLLTVKGTDTATVKLSNKDEQVDLGAYRYSLRHEGEHYYLWSPILEQDIDKAAEEEARRQEEARKQAEEEAKRQEEARKQAEEEAKRQEEARKQAEEEAKRQEEQRKAEEEARRLEEQRKAEEEARRLEEQRKAEEEARRLEEQRKAEEEARRLEEQRKAEEEARRLEEQRKAEEEARKQAEEEARRQEEARKQAEEEAKRQEEQRKAEEEARRLEEQRKAEEEARRLEEQRKAEEEARRLEEQRKAEEEARRLEEQRKAEEEAKRQEEQRKAEEEARRLEEQRKAEEEARRLEEQRKAEEEARRLEEQRKAEEEARRLEEQRKAEEEARRLEEQRKAEEEARRLEEQRKAEEEARRLEEQRKAEEEARRLEEQRKAEEEARRLEEQRKAEEARRLEEQRKAEEARRLEEQRKAEEEARRLEEQRKAEEEARRLEEQRKAEEEARRLEEQRKAEEEARRLEEQRKAEEEARRLEEQRKAEEEARRLEEQRKAEEEARRLEEQRKAEEEARRLEEQRKAEEEARKQAEEEARRQEEARKQAEEEARRQEEARKQAEEEAKRQEEARKQAEEETRRQEEARKQAEEEAKRQEEARKQAEEEARRLEEQRKAEEEARKQAEEEARRLEEQRKAEEEARRLEEQRKAEEEARRLEEQRKAEEEARRLEEQRKAEEEARRLEEQRKAEEEARRLEEQRKAEEEARRLEEQRKAEEEARRLEEQRKAEEEARRLEEQRKAEEEAKRQEEARKQAEEEARRLEEQRKAEEEARKQAEEEARRLEEQRKAEEEARRLEEQRKAEEEARRLEEQRKAEEEARRLEEQRKAEEEARRLEEQRKAEEEARRLEEQRKAEEEARRLEEQRKAEEEARRLEEQRKAEEEARRLEEQRKAEEEAKRQEEARKQAEEETKRQEEQRKAEEEARKQAEEEARRQEEARKQAEEEARRLEEQRKAEEEARRLEEQRNAMAQKQQSELISRYANTALSDVSSQVNSVIHVGDNLNRHLLDDSHTGGVWLNVNRYDETEHSSSYYRDYKKQETLTQIGADTTIDVEDGQLLIGTAYSHSESNNRFDDNASSDSDLDVFSTYGKLTFKDDSFITADVGYGRTDSTIRSEGEEVKSKRHIGTAGLNVGKTFKTEVVDIQPSVGVRYHYLEGHNYNLNGANVEVKDANVLSYRAGVSLKKSFTLSNGIAITPSISSSYVNTTNSKNMVSVNNHSLKQEFGDYGHHEVGVKVGGKQWAVEVHASRSEGNEVNTQNAGGMKFSYKW